MASEPLRDDIAAAKSRMQSRLGAGRELKRLESYLWEGETVQFLASGLYGPGVGLVALTDRRLLFVKDGWTKQIVEDFPMEKISSVQWSSGLLGSLTVFTSGNKAEIKQMDRKDGKVIADEIRQRLSAPPAPAPTPAAAAPAPVAAESTGAEDVYESLRQLGALRDAGIVTPEEFETKKRELLSRI